MSPGASPKSTVAAPLWNLAKAFRVSCHIAAPEPKQEQKTGPVDVSTLSSMLASKWKGGGTAGASADSASKPDQIKAGQIRSFRITKLDPEKKKIELEFLN